MALPGQDEVTRGDFPTEDATSLRASKDIEAIGVNSDGCGYFLNSTLHLDLRFAPLPYINQWLLRLGRDDVIATSSTTLARKCRRSTNHCKTCSDKQRKCSTNDMKCTIFCLVTSSVTYTALKRMCKGTSSGQVIETDTTIVPQGRYHNNFSHCRLEREMKSKVGRSCVEWRMRQEVHWKWK